MKNNMNYEEAVEKLKYYEPILKNAKKELRNPEQIKKLLGEGALKRMRKLYRSCKDDVNLLLSIIHAHKAARKLYAENQVYEKAEAILMEDVKNLVLEKREMRKYFTESVCKECKCEVNTAVNDKLVEENLRLRAELAKTGRKL